MHKPNPILAGLTFGTLLSLKHADPSQMVITHGGPSTDTGKYAGWITTLEGRPVINTPAQFDTPQEAEAHMTKVVEAAKAFEFPPAESPPFSPEKEAVLALFYQNNGEITNAAGKIEAISKFLGAKISFHGTGGEVTNDDRVGMLQEEYLKKIGVRK